MTEEFTMGEIRDHYLLQGKASGWSHHTHESNYRILKFLIDSDYGVGVDTSPNDVTEVRLLNYLIDRKKNGRRGKGMRYSTMNTEFLIIRRFLNWGHLTGYIPELLLQTVTPPRADYQVFEPLTDEEIKSIFAVASRSPQLTAMIGIALDCGLRRGEIATLTTASVNFDNQTLKVLGKRRKWRIVPFGNVCRKLIERHLAFREMLLPRSDAMFIDSDGEGLAGHRLQVRLDTVRKNSGVARLHWHLFRVTYANRFLANGGDSFLLRENMGHTSFAAVAAYIRSVGVSNFELRRRASLLDVGINALSLHKLIDAK